MQFECVPIGIMPYLPRKREKKWTQSVDKSLGIGNSFERGHHMLKCCLWFCFLVDHFLLQGDILTKKKLVFSLG